MRSLIAIAALCFAVACDHEHEEGFDTYQECFDDHTMEESLPFQEAVVVCCTDHPIGNVEKDACGADAAACVTYLGANLTSTATPAEVMAACTEYETQKGQ